MKTIKQGFVWVFALLSALSLRAVDGLQIQIYQQTNVMVSWPSLPGQTYTVIFTRDLNDPVQWQVLQSDYQAAEGTNVTTFVHYDQIPVQPGGGGGSDSFSMLSSGGWLNGNEPLAMPADGSGDAVPLCVYPPGFDFSDFLIFDPNVAEWVQGSTYSKEEFEIQSDGPQPQNFDGSDGTNTLSCGFYRVLGVKVLSGITNSTTVSDFFTVSVRPEIGVKFLQLLVDGKPFPGLDPILPPFTNVITFDFVDSSRLSNGGPYTIQAEAVYQIESPDSEGLYHALSQPFSVSTFNELSFPNWDFMTEDEVFGFDIVSAHRVVDWEIDVYNIFDYIDWLNGQNPNIFPIHIRTGSTTNGIIQYDWNFVDDFGFTRTNVNDDPYFVSFTFTSWSSSASGPSPQAAGSAGAPNPLKYQPSKWPRQGHWVVAWQDMFRHYYDKDNDFKTSFVNIRNMANLPADDVPAAPPFWQGPIGGTNAQTFPIRHFYNGFRQDLNPTNQNFFDSTTYDQFLFQLMLRDGRARNLFYYGHGSPDWIADIVYANLLRDYGMHRYRFVWLDGCETANGSWPETFGITGPGLFTIDYYKERTKRPALFIGNKYSTPIGIPKENYQVGGVTFNGDIPKSKSEFYNQFIFYWKDLGRTYKLAHESAQNLIKGAYPTPVMRYLIGPPAGFPYWPGDDQERIGYEEMKFNDYNKDYAIPRP